MKVCINKIVFTHGIIIDFIQRNVLSVVFTITMSVIRKSDISILLTIVIGLENESRAINKISFGLSKENEIINHHLGWFLGGPRHEVGFNDLCNHPSKVFVVDYIAINVHEFEYMVGISMTRFSLLPILGIMSSGIRCSAEVRNKLGCISKDVLPVGTHTT